MNLLLNLNEYYNRQFEQWIATSIFATGGIRHTFVRRKLKAWLRQTAGLLLEIGSGDRKWQAYIPAQTTYLTLDYLPVAESCPWRTAIPDINGDGLALPLKDACLDAVLNVHVLEHVRDPARLIQEIARVLKPGGLLLLVGPGDITCSHGEPYMFFNLTRYAYQMLLTDNNLEVLEEYFPSKTCVSVAQLLYLKFVRNQVYRKNNILKCVQIPIFLSSLLLSPLINILALILDVLLPFDQRGYDLYMVFARKHEAEVAPAS